MCRVNCRALVCVFQSEFVWNSTFSPFISVEYEEALKVRRIKARPFAQSLCQVSSIKRRRRGAAAKSSYRTGPNVSLTSSSLAQPERGQTGQQTAHERVRDPGAAGEGPHHQDERNGTQEGLQAPAALPGAGAGGQSQSAGGGAGTGHGETRSLSLSLYRPRCSGFMSTVLKDY